MKQEFLCRATSGQLLNLRQELRSPYIKTIRPKLRVSARLDFYDSSVAHARPVARYTNYCGDVELFLSAPGKVNAGRGCSVVLTHGEQGISKLTLYYNTQEDLDLVRDTWELLFSRMVRRGWIDRQPAPARSWHGGGHLPQSRADKISALRAWDALDPDERPRLSDWLMDNFGTDPATGAQLVPASTFRSWRRYL